MLTDKFGRTINYLRIALTDRCNLRCIYCQPPEGIVCKKRAEILSYEEISDFVRVAVGLGITKIRLTGGEPLLRKSICDIVGMLGSIIGIEDLALTTNGVLLDKYAVKLKSAGLKRVNVSLDSLKPERYKIITRGGDINSVLRGIVAAKEAGLIPVKINCVIIKGTNDDEIDDFLCFGQKYGVEIQFIQRMKLDQHKPIIEDTGLIKRPPDCRSCNRVRLTADGFLKPCLFSNDEINIRCYDYQYALKQVVDSKPKTGDRCSNRPMVSIGG